MSEPKRGWFARLTEGLSKSSRQMGDQIAQVFVAKAPLDQARLDELEEMLIEADLGPHSAARIVERFAAEKFGKDVDEAEIRETLAGAIGDELEGRQGVFDPLSGPRPNVVLLIGVNGSGKTTTLGKIAADLTRRGAKVLVVAGDTFRAAAVEQLKIWADRAGADFLGRPTGSDAAGLVFDAVNDAATKGYDVVLVDTAGRLQNKQGLMDELLKIIRVLKKLDPDASGAGRHGGAQCPGPGEHLRQPDRRHRHRHDQARRYGARRCACARRPGVGQSDQAGGSRRGNRRPATL
jgi:fused signal recognition particle receptor